MYPYACIKATSHPCPDITQIKTLSRNVMFETAMDEADREALMASMEPVRACIVHMPYYS